MAGIFPSKLSNSARNHLRNATVTKGGDTLPKKQGRLQDRWSRQVARQVAKTGCKTGCLATTVMAVGGELSTATAVASLATVSLSAHPGENPPPRSPCHGVNDACVVLLLTTAVQRSFHNHVGMRNSSVRQMWYKKSLDMWHGDTAWRDALVVVENGGFDEWNKEYPSFEVLTFVHSRAQQRIFCDNNSVIDGRSPYAGGHHELALPPG